MTDRLYYKDAYIRSFTANVISCTEKSGKYEIVLDRTAFFPEGGGQPGDRGAIGSSKVLDTVLRDDEIIHICSSPESGECECSLDWDFRFLNMQQHSGEHIFSGVLHSLTGLDNVGFHMSESEKEVTVDFSGPVSAETIALAEKKINEFIWANVPVTCFYPPEDEISSYDYRSKKEIDGPLRLVKIEGADLCACCGTHVARTGETGAVKIITSESNRGGVRITLKIGSLALEDYIEKNNSVLEISASLCAKHHEVSQAVEKLKEKQNELRIEISNLNKKIISLLARGFTDEFPCVVDSRGSSDFARMLADAGASQVKIAFAFSGDDKNGYKYAVASKLTDVRETGKLLNSALGGRGGGKPEMIMGSVTASLEQIKAFIESVK
ncbi:MAG: hypothetical protein IJM02_05245 [Clostridia bacterium]|nr:hypothetical protein [Clostridia bacterium]